MAYRIEATIAASNVLWLPSLLRVRVVETLTGILETGEDLHRTGQHTLSGIAEEGRRVHVAGHLVWYVVDPERRTVQILLIDRAAGDPEGPSNIA